MIKYYAVIFVETRCLEDPRIKLFENQTDAEKYFNKAFAKVRDNYQTYSGFQSSFMTFQNGTNDKAVLRLKELERKWHNAN